MWVWLSALNPEEGNMKIIGRELSYRNDKKSLKKLVWDLTEGNCKIPAPARGKDENPQGALPVPG